MSDVFPESMEGYDLSEIVKDPSKDKDRVALFMNPCPFDIAYADIDYCADKTATCTYAKMPDGPSMLFNNVKDSLQLNNLVGDEGFRGLW